MMKIKSVVTTPRHSNGCHGHLATHFSKLCYGANLRHLYFVCLNWVLWVPFVYCSSKQNCSFGCLLTGTKRSFSQSPTLLALTFSAIQKSKCFLKKFKERERKTDFKKFSANNDKAFLGMCFTLVTLNKQNCSCSPNESLYRKDKNVGQEQQQSDWCQKTDWSSSRLTQLALSNTK